MKEKDKIPTGLFLLNLLEEAQSEESRLVMECLEKYLPDYFKEHYSDKMFVKQHLSETLIIVEKALSLYNLSTMIRHLDYKKDERRKILEEPEANLFSLS